MDKVKFYIIGYFALNIYYLWLTDREYNPNYKKTFNSKFTKFIKYLCIISHCIIIFFAFYFKVLE